MAVIGIIFLFAHVFGLGVWLGWILGWARGFGESRREYEKGYKDLLTLGTSFMKDGKRIDPKEVFK